jgi:hypothetical protein
MPAPVVNTAALLGHGLVGRSLGALRGSSLSSPNYRRIFGFVQENVEIILNSRSPSRRSRAGKLLKTELRQRFHGHMAVKA